MTNQQQGKSRWPLHFAEGEREARRAAGEWTGETLGDMARLRAQTAADRLAVVGETGGLTFAALLGQATALARGFLETGLASGDTISFMLPNWTEAVVVDLACALGGFVINPIIPIYREAELRFILNDCAARAVIAPENFRGVDYPAMLEPLRKDAPALEHIIIARGAAPGCLGLEDLIDAGRRSDRKLEEADPDQAKLIMYTSGTTGRPKGVIYSQNQQRRPLWASMQVWGLEAGARCIMPSPVTHVTGFGYGMEMPMLFGTQTYFLEKWDAGHAVEMIDEYAIEFTVGATPFLAELLDEAERRGSTLESFRIFACGGAAVPPGLIRRANRSLAQCRAFRVFGSSECPVITQGCPENQELSATTDGRVFDWEVKIVDDEGRRLGPGREGEILARGPSLFRGYTDAAANEAAFDEDGYFRTGDLGVMTEDDVITITGRKKDIIIRGGENISAKEIEDALHDHPAIREAAAVAMPHPRLGEGVCAFLIMKVDERPSVAELGDYLRAAGLARQKWPERLEFVDELPKTGSGKIQKHILRGRLAEETSPPADERPGGA